MLFRETQDDHGTQWAAIRSIADRIGCSGQALRNWVRQAEADAGTRPGLASDERERLRELERENRELRRSNGILKTASALMVEIQRVFDDNCAVYGHRKVWARLNPRASLWRTARCSVRQVASRPNGETVVVDVSFTELSNRPSSHTTSPEPERARPRAVPPRVEFLTSVSANRRIDHVPPPNAWTSRHRLPQGRSYADQPLRDLMRPRPGRETGTPFQIILQASPRPRRRRAIRNASRQPNLL